MNETQSIDIEINETMLKFILASNSYLEVNMKRVSSTIPPIRITAVNLSPEILRKLADWLETLDKVKRRKT